jgi:hypothetical protein
MQYNSHIGGERYDGRLSRNVRERFAIRNYMHFSFMCLFAPGECLDVWMSGCLDVWMSGCLDVCMSGCLCLFEKGQKRGGGLTADVVEKTTLFRSTDSPTQGTAKRPRLSPSAGDCHQGVVQSRSLLQSKRNRHLPTAFSP